MNKTFKIEDCIAGYCGDIVLDTNHELKEYEDKIVSIIKDKVKSNILKALKYLHTNSGSTINVMINKLDDIQTMDDNNLSEYIFNEYVKIKSINVIDDYSRKISIVIPIISERISNIDIVDEVIKMALILKRNLKGYKNETKIEYKITDLLKDYVVLHERIKILYKMLEIYRYIDWYNSTHNKKKNYWRRIY